MAEYEQKAKNFFILGKISEKLNMYTEAAANYFKALTALNDHVLEKINLRATDHNERFALLKENLPDLYELTDRLFILYRRTYTQQLSLGELILLRQKVEEAFHHATIDIPTDEEIENKTERLYKN